MPVLSVGAAVVGAAAVVVVGPELNPATPIEAATAPAAIRANPPIFSGDAPLEPTGDVTSTSHTTAVLPAELGRT
jgi:hypothetical protein